MTQEKIGKVLLDYTYYSGEDYYSDGAVEDRMLEMAMTIPSAELSRAAAGSKDWAILYHMSQVRENILGAVDLAPGEKVLEIGSGCGAVTGELLRRTGNVACAELSRKRSLINAYRNKDMEGLTIHVGNFQEMEKSLDEDYDCITMIGVLEYARSYIAPEASGEKEAEGLSGLSPYLVFLRLAKKHLKPGGKLVVAIENRLGLKYFAGCREDHTGHLFESIEDYPDPVNVRTFSRPELDGLFESAGFAQREFYYPYPDYKLPMVIYSDSYLPREGDLRANLWNFDRDRLYLFDEEKAYDSFLRSGVYPLFANSFLVISRQEKTEGEEERIVYSRSAGERSPEYAARTNIRQMPSGERLVEKYPLYPELGREHIARLTRCEEALRRQFAGTGLKVNRILSGTDGIIRLEYLAGRKTLEEILGIWWRQGDKEEVRQVLRRLCQALEDGALEDFSVTSEFARTFGLIDWPAGAKSLPVTDLDMVPENILVDENDGSWELIDYEWTAEFPVPVRFVQYRIWYYFLQRKCPEIVGDEEYLQAGFTRSEMQVFSQMEAAWQNRIMGGLVPLRELYLQMNPGIRDVKEELLLQEEQGERSYASTFYYQTEDHGFSEELRIQRRLLLKPDGSFSLEVPLEEMGDPGELLAIRWDPMELHACRVRIEEIAASSLVTARPYQGYRENGWDTFWTLDPAYYLQGDLAHAGRIVLKGRLELLNLAAHLDEIRQIREQRDALKTELEATSAALTAQQSTRAFRTIEKLRAARNFVMARMRALPPLRDKNVLPQPYQDWARSHQATQAELEAQRLCRLPVSPRFSILVPTYRTPETYLRAMIESVLAQTYGNWQLCIADASVSEDGTADEQVRTILAQYAEMDERICVSYLEKNEGISENTNAAAALCSGDYIMLLDHDDTLAPEALFEFAAAIARSGADFLYSDEDKMSMDGKSFFDANLKPDFSPDLLRSHNYITHLLCLKLELFLQAGGFHGEYDGAQDYDLILRCSELTESIVHIPKILYHWRMHENSTAQNPESKMYAYEAGRKAIDAHLDRTGIPGKAELLPLWGLYRVVCETPGDPLVSVIIPSKDHTEDLDKCVRSLLTGSTYRQLEIIVVENNSTQQETFDYYDRIQKEFPQVRVVIWEKEFNFAAINNYGVSFAKGEYLLLLNNDTELMEPGSVGEMLGLCQRSDVGCVGAKLLYADDTVQHAGVILGPGGFAGHVFSGLKKDDYGFMMRAQITGNYSVVTGACLMVSKEKYQEVGGMTERFAVALNDVDFCLKLRKKGYLVVFTPFAMWHHYESKSRGYEDTPEKKERFQREIDLFRAKWGRLVDAGDPYYNPNFAKDKAPFTLY